MKTFVIALATAILIAGQLFTPAATASLASKICGDTYTVQHGDYLAKISRLCKISLADILALNPQIVNPNLIYIGQVLRLADRAATIVTYSTTYTVQYGDTLLEIAAMFNTGVWTIIQANPSISSNGSIYTGMVLNIPASTYTGYARVTLSTTRAATGDEVTVYVSGFPANAWIDYRVGQQEEDYSVAYDGIVDAHGATSIIIEIPDDANDGEYWVVLVTTTSQKEDVEEYSPVIYIDN